MAGKGAGGGERKKTSDKDDVPTTARIPDIVGEVLKRDGDAKSVADAIDGTIDIEKWLTEMNIETLETVNDFLAKYEARGNSDFVIKGLAKHMPSIVALEAKPPYKSWV